MEGKGAICLGAPLEQTDLVFVLIGDVGIAEDALGLLAASVLAQVSETYSSASVLLLGGLCTEFVGDSMWNLRSCMAEPDNLRPPESLIQQLVKVVNQAISACKKRQPVLLLGGFSLSAIVALHGLVELGTYGVTGTGIAVISGLLDTSILQQAAEHCPLPAERGPFRIFLSHGKNDPLIPESSARAGIEAARKLHQGMARGLFLDAHFHSGAHELGPGTAEALAEWLLDIAETTGIVEVVQEPAPPQASLGPATPPEVNPTSSRPVTSSVHVDEVLHTPSVPATSFGPVSSPEGATSSTKPSASSVLVEEAAAAASPLARSSTFGSKRRSGFSAQLSQKTPDADQHQLHSQANVAKEDIPDSTDIPNAEEASTSTPVNQEYQGNASECASTRCGVLSAPCVGQADKEEVAASGDPPRSRSSTSAPKPRSGFSARLSRQNVDAEQPSSTRKTSAALEEMPGSSKSPSTDGVSTSTSFSDETRENSSRRAGKGRGVFSAAENARKEQAHEEAPPSVNAAPTAANPAKAPTSATTAAREMPPNDTTQTKIEVGDLIKIHGLKSRPDLNGELATAQQWVSDKGRWQVEILSTSEAIAIKLANLGTLGLERLDAAMKERTTTSQQLHEIRYTSIDASYDTHQNLESLWGPGFVSMSVARAPPIGSTLETMGRHQCLVYNKMSQKVALHTSSPTILLFRGHSDRKEHETRATRFTDLANAYVGKFGAQVVVPIDTIHLSQLLEMARSIHKNLPPWLTQGQLVVHGLDTGCIPALGLAAEQSQRDAIFEVQLLVLEACPRSLSAIPGMAIDGAVPDPLRMEAKLSITRCPTVFVEGPKLRPSVHINQGPASLETNGFDSLVAACCRDPLVLSMASSLTEGGNICNQLQAVINKVIRNSAKDSTSKARATAHNIQQRQGTDWMAQMISGHICEADGIPFNDADIDFGGDAGHETAPATNEWMADALSGLAQADGTDFDFGGGVRQEAAPATNAWIADNLSGRIQALENPSPSPKPPAQQALSGNVVNQQYLVDAATCLVRESEGLKSQEVGRLKRGAVIQMVVQRGQRIKFRKIEGDGPEEGWISTMVNSKAVLKPAE